MTLKLHYVWHFFFSQSSMLDNESSAHVDLSKLDAWEPMFILCWFVKARCLRTNVHCQSSMLEDKCSAHVDFCQRWILENKCLAHVDFFSNLDAWEQTVSSCWFLSKLDAWKQMFGACWFVKARWLKTNVQHMLICQSAMFENKINVQLILICQSTVLQNKCSAHVDLSKLDAREQMFSSCWFVKS